MLSNNDIMLLEHDLSCKADWKPQIAYSIILINEVEYITLLMINTNNGLMEWFILEEILSIL